MIECVFFACAGCQIGAAMPKTGLISGEFLAAVGIN